MKSLSFDSKDSDEDLDSILAYTNLLNDIQEVSKSLIIDHLSFSEFLHLISFPNLINLLQVFLLRVLEKSALKRIKMRWVNYWMPHTYAVEQLSETYISIG